jgi:hypothetical protein
MQQGSVPGLGFAQAPGVGDRWAETVLDNGKSWHIISLPAWRGSLHQVIRKGLKAQ